MALVELTVFGGVLPLASGYLEAFALADPALAAAFTFEKRSIVAKAPRDEILRSLEASDADVYGFSCYVWNGRLVRWLVESLRRSRSDAVFLLGGPQVMRKGESYVPIGEERVFVCNGEGERTFRGFLQALVGRRELASVGGLSFRRDGVLVTTEDEPRISDLEEIPSPFLSGVFTPGEHPWAVIETNRGCPFQCTYCCWGAATGSRVYKFDQRRIERELEWVSRAGCFYLFFADANWGMLPRDVELTRHLATCKTRWGAPHTVYFAGAKNTPERVGEITRTLHDAGMITTQSIALQTMSEEALARVRRANVKVRTYTELQRALNAEGMSSFVEMIWPLPGETLESFRAGIGELCAIGADSFLVYPLLLVNNVAMTDMREELGLVTRPDPDPNGEAEVVVGTSEVSRADYDEGLRFSYALAVLHSLRGLRCTAGYLAEAGSVRPEELLARFVEHCRGRADHPYVRYCEESIATFGSYAFNDIGGVMYGVLHSDREAFDELLLEFASTQEWWLDPLARLSLELDLVQRPYLFSNCPIAAKRVPLESLRVSPRASGYQVEVPQELRPLVRRAVGLSEPPGGVPPTGLFEVCHRREQLPHMPAKPLEEHYAYAQDMLHKVRSLLPRWTEIDRRPRRTASQWLAPR